MSTDDKNFGGSSSSPSAHCDSAFAVEWVRQDDGSALIDHRGTAVSISRMLATKPLRCELQTRPGPGGRRLTYVSGDSVTRSLNEIFGYDGWNLDIKQTKREDMKQEKERFHVAYSALVRLTHRKSGTYKEEFGFGDSTDRSMATAISHAVKASITDAMKRAARLFGDKLGNSLYESSFNVGKAPTTLEAALDLYDQERAKKRFRTKPQVKQPIGLESVAKAKAAAVEQQQSHTNGIENHASNVAMNQSGVQKNYSGQRKNREEQRKPVDLSGRAPSNVTNLQTPAAGMRERYPTNITPASEASQQRTAQPPPSSPAHHGSQSSCNFGLTKFVSNRDSFDGSNRENRAMSDSFSDQRPTTSSGPRQSFEMGPPSSGPRKRPLSHQPDEVHPPNKRNSINPYSR